MEPSVKYISTIGQLKKFIKLIFFALVSLNLDHTTWNNLAREEVSTPWWNRDSDKGIHKRQIAFLHFRQAKQIAQFLEHQLLSAVLK